jgi:hypothetical protein
VICVAHLELLLGRPVSVPHDRQYAAQLLMRRPLVRLRCLEQVRFRQLTQRRQVLRSDTHGKHIVPNYNGCVYVLHPMR